MKAEKTLRLEETRNEKRSLLLYGQYNILEMKTEIRFHLKQTI